VIIDIHLQTLKHYIVRFLVFVMAFQVLNLSVYPELLQWYRSESATNLNNDMDSLVEYVTEIVFGQKDAFPEYAHKHHKELQIHKQAISLYSEEMAANNAGEPFIRRPMEGAAPDQYSYQYYSEINPPPPKA